MADIKWKYTIGEHIQTEKSDITIIDTKINRKQMQYKAGNPFFTNEKWYKYRCCKCSNEDWITEKNLLRLQIICLKCTETTNWKYKIGDRIKNDVQDFTITDRKIVVAKAYTRLGEYKYTEYKKFYKYTCNKCGFTCGIHYRKEKYYEDMWIVENNLFHKKACSCCSHQITVPGINDIPTTAAWMIPYFPNGYNDAKKYQARSSVKINFVCPDCGNKSNKKIIISTLYYYHSIGCNCSDGISYPNKFSYALLDQLKEYIKSYKKEFSPKWCKFKYMNTIRSGRFDNMFVLKSNNKKYILEMDGAFHKNDSELNGQSAEQSIYIDKEKDRLALEHKYTVIRIDCDYKDNDKFLYIRNNILNSEDLKKIFDLNKINWDKCNEFARSNLSIQLCEYKKNNPTAPLKELQELFGIGTSTIYRYLKTNLGNEYNIMVKSLNRKTVLIYKDNVLVGEYPTVVALERDSVSKFGVYLESKGIYKVLHGEKSSYKDYFFKYIDEILDK